MVRFYAPDGAVEKTALELTPIRNRGPELRIAVLDNRKDNAFLLLSETAAGVGKHFGAGPAILTDKGNASVPAPESLVEGLVRDVDLVLTGSAD